MSPFPNISLFAGVQISQLPACCVLYVILVAFWKNRQFHYGANGWYELFSQLEFGCVDEIIISQYYQRRPKYAGVVVLFLFLCWLFEIPHTELVRFVTEHRRGFWRRVLPLPKRILQTVSEFVGTSGQHVSSADLTRCFECLIAQIFEIVGVEHLSDADLFDYCRYFTFCTTSSGNEALPDRARGGHYFANLIFSLGMGAALSLCQKDEQEQKQEQKPAKQPRMLTGFGYSSTQLVCAILSTPGTKNITQLAKEFRNTGDFYSGLRPSAQVLRQFITRLDKDKVVMFYEHFVSSVRRVNGFGKVVVAIDATIIEVFGDYEDAEWVYDHDQHKSVRGYKLYLVFDVTHLLPLGFVLAGSESECTKLLDLVTKAQAIVGVDNIEFVLFDRGYFDTQEFAALDDDGTQFVTPGKHCKTFKEIIAAFEQDLSLYEPVDEHEMRVSFYLHDFINFMGASQWKWARVTIRRRLLTKRKKDRNTGKVMLETHVQHSIYITNILDGSVEDVVTTYGQRTAIENFFEEVKNAYFITGFPGTSRNSVEVSIALTLLQHLLLWLFCSFLTTDSGEHPYTHKELTSVKLDLLERPATEVFDAHEALSAEVLDIQRGIEQDMGCIRAFRRCIQRTRPEPRKISCMASFHDDRT
jgi:hypothetical protein